MTEHFRRSPSPAAAGRRVQAPGSAASGASPGPSANESKGSAADLAKVDAAGGETAPTDLSGVDAARLGPATPASGKTPGRSTGATALGGSTSRRSTLSQLLLVLRSPLLAETLRAVLQDRLSEAGVPVTVVLPSDQSGTRGPASGRALLTDRVDALSMQLISQTIPAEVTVCLGTPEAASGQRKGRAAGRGSRTESRQIVLPADADADTVFTELLPLFPPPPTAPSRSRSRPIGPKLSPRETEVLRQIASGRSVRDIAAELNLAPKTVENQKYRMMDKLQIRNTAELTRYAIRIGLIEP